MRTAPTRLDDILEADWQRDIVALARQFGWLTYHTFNSRRSTHGFPDLVLLRDRVVYLELKREKTRCTDDQKLWLRCLRSAGAEVYVGRPSDLDDLAVVLSQRRTAASSPAAGRLRQRLIDEIGE